MSEVHRRRSRLWARVRRTTWRGWFGVLLLVAIVVFGTWYVVDTATLHGRVPRNVSVAGVPIGRRSDAATERALAAAAERYSHTRIELVDGTHVLNLQAADVGLHLDPAATLAAARQVGRHDNELARPFLWLASFFRPRRTPVRVTVDQERLAAALARLPGQVPVQEPAVIGSPYAIGVRAGHDGQGFAASDVAQGLQRAATLGKLPIRVALQSRVIAPRYSEADAVRLVPAATRLTAGSIALVTSDDTAVVGPNLLRSWLTSRAGPHGLELAFRRHLVQQAAIQLLGRVQHPPVDAAFTVVNDEVQLLPQKNGTQCCAENTADVVYDAMVHGKPAVRVPLIQTPPPFTTAKAVALGITTRIGTNSPLGDRKATVGFNPPDEPNVALAAATLRGHILLPAQSLSLNQLLGAPSPANGYEAAPQWTADGPTLMSGAGEDSVAAALFGASFYAGLDIVSSTAHGVQLPWLPAGVEADLQWPGPDLVVRNSLPHAVLIWTDVTGSSVTVSLYSSPWVSSVSASQTSSRVGPKQRCTRLVTVRTVTSPAGARSDTFTAVYAPYPQSRTDPIRTTC